MSMDTASEHALSLLTALSTALDRLHVLGYDLYLKTGTGWSSTSSRNITVSGSPFRIHKSDVVEEFERLYVIGFSLNHPDPDRSLIFSMDVAHRASGWFVQSNVEDATFENHLWLWQSEEYWTHTLEGLLQSIQQATDALLESPNAPKVAEMLEDARKNRKPIYHETLEPPPG